jgi:outer membrane protein OmpA-like peptidoglycan-associated protein
MPSAPLSLNKTSGLLLLLAALSGCTTLPQSPSGSQSAQATSGQSSPRRTALTSIGLKPLDRSEARAYMDKAADELENLLKDTGVSVTHKDNDLILTLPGDLSFDSGSAVVEARVFKLLDNLAVVLNRYDSTYIDILGHADASGRAKENDVLSEQRANATAGYLVAQNVAYQRLSVAGVGSAHPLASNQSPKGRAKNRRVEIVIRPLV